MIRSFTPADADSVTVAKVFEMSSAKYLSNLVTLVENRTTKFIYHLNGFCYNFLHGLIINAPVIINWRRGRVFISTFILK